MTYGDNKTAHRLTVIGDRQDGKTHLAGIYAITEGRLGSQVLFESVTGEYCAQILKSCVELLGLMGIEYTAAHQSNGNQRITFANGGCIRFIPTGTWMHHRYDCDVHIIDEGSDMVHPQAKRILRTALR